MYGTSFIRSRSSAAIVFASCISANVPSCIRAPPDALTMTSGIRSSRAASAARATFSPDDRAHRAAHEPEVHDDDRDRRALDPAGAPHGGVAEARRELRGRDAVRVRLLVDEPERVLRHEPGVALRPGALVEELRQAHGRRQPEVVAARRADVHRLLELLVEQLLLARRAARPHVLGAGGLATRAEGRELHRHQAGPPRPGVVAAAAAVEAVAMTSAETPAAARRARAARAARAMARLLDRPATGRGRGARGAPRDVRDPDQRDRRGRDRPAHEQRPPGARAGGRRGRRRRRRSGRARRGGSPRPADRPRGWRGDAPGSSISAPPPAAARAGLAWLAASSASRPARRSSNRNDGWTRTSEARSTRAASRTSGSRVAWDGASVGVAVDGGEERVQVAVGDERVDLGVVAHARGVVVGRAPVALAAELPGDGAQRAVDEDADRALRAAEHAGDLRGAHLLDEPEREGAPPVVGQGAHRAQRLAGLVAGHGVRLEVRGIGDREARPEGRLERRGRAAAPRASLVRDGVARDPEQPDAERGRLGAVLRACLLAEPGHGGQGAQEHALGGVLGGVVITELVEGVGIHLGEVLPIQGVEAGGVAPGCLHQ